ncbi:MAG: NAD(P)/FAD-dependent oxidoreductase [Candidatus Omnitrophica bacterium]|nr:NAD(P)/FAD-dependent oxidoreductase [Candidatus Omnitrophota bacterium]
MKKILLLGSSPAAINAVEIIKSQIECEIVFLPLSDHLVVDKQRYIEMIDKQLRTKQIYYRPKDFYEKTNIKIINDKKVTRVNLSRKKVHFEDRSQLDFDVIILSDTPDHRQGDLKGSNKSGVFGFKNINDIEQISTLAALNSTITIEGDQWWTVELAMLMANKNKEIILSVSANYPLIHGTSDEYKQWIVQTLKSKGIQLLIDNPIVEILGESDLKAIKVRSGKVYAADLVILENTYLDTRVFNEAIEIGDAAVVVDEHYKSNLEDVYAVDFAAQRSQELWNSYGPRNEFLEYQSHILAASVLKKEETYDLPIPTFFVSQENFSLTSIGQVVERRNVQSVMKTDSTDGRLIKLFEKDGLFIGIIALNVNVVPHDVIERIRNKSEINSIKEHFFSLMAPLVQVSSEYSSAGELEKAYEQTNSA